MTIRIDRIVTRGGDRGETALGNGTRVPKDCARIEALGALDEANATIGLLRATLPAGRNATFIAWVQGLLFDIGGALCMPASPPRALPHAAAALDAMEGEVERLRADIPPLRSFVLPGGTPAAAHAHLARTVVRRAERRLVTLARAEDIGTDMPACLNRLSDYLFVLGRHLNANGAEDLTWAPAAPPPA
ncbi:ATP:cob(I)alamin adenosyltransferase [Komagataeibacter rhaeticus]|uniref:Corrinoid adenosyltransferase n=1 Tax=Komagataeibacter rhaeticus TaxID=215221 RepID=A0A181CC56_9PROT|nr:cob(I)yrinic acid a,c-diamide adenosyltransferase [Komagataeibacter rhaeticus]ATU72018.1 ATP:cob(I)alamin adenosyltransferase [Komagataeibacter xylinus]EGG75439.1 Cob(I)yrinic acid a-c-diamide adenosyltransferase [Gluconacetobacter sp. SXCC-1]KDU95682.1 cob(I)yrinic acid a c-diamide adenosyltransferase [Komagataeibacter rhaeticus AF1]MBL7239437.1 cob(I)yrinic acid a,c-diamide adenosyltransferase [Komagataeibacter rhaeticus]PYD54559.1 ATP:cob(I)alamin adenosyltransferase [Komagataeibacter rh